MYFEDQHERRLKRQKIYSDLDAEEGEETEDMYSQILMLSSLASNDVGSKMTFGVNKKEGRHISINDPERGHCLL